MAAGDPFEELASSQRDPALPGESFARYHARVEDAHTIDIKQRKADLDQRGIAYYSDASSSSPVVVREPATGDPLYKYGDSGFAINKQGKAYGLNWDETGAPNIVDPFDGLAQQPKLKKGTPWQMQAHGDADDDAEANDSATTAQALKTLTHYARTTGRQLTDLEAQQVADEQALPAEEAELDELRTGTIPELQRRTKPGLLAGMFGADDDDAPYVAARTELDAKTKRATELEGRITQRKTRAAQLAASVQAAQAQAAEAKRLEIEARALDVDATRQKLVDAGLVAPAVEQPAEALPDGALNYLGQQVALPDEQVAQIMQQPEQRMGYLDEIARGLGRGSAQFTSALGGFLRMMGMETTGQFLNDAGENFAEGIEASPEVGTFQPASPRWWAARLPEVVPQLASQLGLAFLSRGASVPAQIAAFGAVGGATMAGDAYNQAIADRLGRGENPDTARDAAVGEAAVVGTIGAALDLIPGTEFLSKTPIVSNLLSKAIRNQYARAGVAGFVAEALPEIGQEVTADLANLGFRGNVEQFNDAWERYMAAGTLGGVAGAGIDVAKTAIEGQQPAEEAPAIPGVATTATPASAPTPPAQSAPLPAQAAPTNQTTSATSPQPAHAPADPTSKDTPPPQQPGPATGAPREVPGANEGAGAPARSSLPGLEDGDPGAGSTSQPKPNAPSGGGGGSATSPAIPGVDTPTVDGAAGNAATSPTNELREPSEAQKAAGNYQKGHVKVSGLDISIENPAGSARVGKSASGKAWSVEMKSHYGYIRGSKGKDGDHIDIFIKRGTPTDYEGPVFVVNQLNEKGEFDEHKAVLGAATEFEARKLYRENYTGVRHKLIDSVATFKDMASFTQWATGASRRKAPAKGDEKNSSPDGSPAGHGNTEPAPEPSGGKTTAPASESTRGKPRHAELVQILQKKHPAYPIGSDRIANANQFIRQHAAELVDFDSGGELHQEREEAIRAQANEALKGAVKAARQRNIAEDEAENKAADERTKSDAIKPSEHGVYDDAAVRDEDRISRKGKNYSWEVRALEVAPGKWVSASSGEVNTGSFPGSGGPLSERGEKHTARAEALQAALATARRLFVHAANDQASPANDAQRAAAKSALAEIDAEMAKLGSDKEATNETTNQQTTGETEEEPGGDRGTQAATQGRDAEPDDGGVGEEQRARSGEVSEEEDVTPARAKALLDGLRTGTQAADAALLLAYTEGAQQGAGFFTDAEGIGLDPARIADRMNILAADGHDAEAWAESALGEERIHWRQVLLEGLGRAE